MPNILNKNKALYLLILFSLIIWFLKCPMIFGDLDDASFKWAMSKFALYHWPLEFWQWNHHTSRIGIFIFAWIFQFIFGSHPLVYFLPNLLMFLTCIFLLYKIAYDKVLPVIFISFFLCYVLSQDMVYHFSQLEVSIYSQAFILAAFYFITKDSGPKILFAGLSFFGAYLCKEDNLFFLPGLVAIFFIDKNWKSGVSFLAILFSFYLFETAAYALSTNYPLGRAEVIFKSFHFQTPGIIWESVDSLWLLFKRFIYISGNLKKFFYFYIITLPIALFFLKNKIHKQIINLTLVILSFYLCITFAVNSIAPYHTIMPFEGRFLMSTYPLLILYGIFLFQDLLNLDQMIKIKLFLTHNFSVKRATGVLFVILLIVAIRERENIKNHSFSKMITKTYELNQAYQKGSTFVARNIRSLHYFRSYLWMGFNNSKNALPIIWEGSDQQGPIYILQKNFKELGAKDELYSLTLEDGVSYNKINLDKNIIRTNLAVDFNLDF